MVYCSKCGTENPDGAANCSKCGVSLSASSSHEWRTYRHDGDFFRRGHVWGVLIGLFIVMIGVADLIGVSIWDKVWPMFLILIGIIIVANSFMKRRW